MNSKYFLYLQDQSKRLFILTLTILSILSATCIKIKIPPPAAETETVTDRDGNVYKTIKIGSQWWMMENLKVKTYLNGDPVIPVLDTATWHHAITGSFCVFDNNSLAPGLLYNGYAVTDNRGLAPAGWHISSDADWTQLEEFLGMGPDEAGKIGWRGSHEAEKLKKSLSQTTITGDWTPISSVWNTNETRFTALAGGCRLFNGKWSVPGLGEEGFWWTSSVRNTDAKMWYRYMDYKNSKIFRYVAPLTYGCSIRCVKDPQ